MKGLQYLRRALIMAVMALCLTFAAVPAMDTHAAAVQTEVQTVETTASEDEEIFFFFIMGGGLLIILFAVAASVSSVSSIAGILDEAAGEDKAV